MNRPLPEGTRVHHRACEWSYGFTEEMAARRPGWGWGTVVKAYPQRDYTEYEVEMDKPLFEGGQTRTFWPGHLIDSARGPLSVSDHREHGLSDNELRGMMQ